MTRKRTLLLLLAGLALLVASPAFAVKSEPVQIFEYPAPYPIQAHFPDQNPIEIPKPIPPDDARGISLSPSSPTDQTSSVGPALGGSSMNGVSPILGAQGDSGMKLDTEGLVRTARRELDG